MREIDIGGDVTLACTTSGKGPPLLLLHGAEGSHRMFDAIAPLLAPDFTVIAYDQRDCGATRNPGLPVRLQDLADDAIALLNALDIDVAYVYGHSFGGRLAQCLAASYSSRVTALILGSTWRLPDALEDLNPQGVGRILALRERLPASSDELATYFLPEAVLKARPDLQAIFRQSPPRSERTARRAVTTADRPNVLPADIGVRTLCLAGELDRVVPTSASRALADELAHSAFVLLSGVGHAGVVQVPEVIARHVSDFCLGGASAAGSNQQGARDAV